MPELPEVETVARQLSPLLGDCLFKRIEILDPKLNHLDQKFLRGQRVKEVKRIGKQVAIVLPSGFILAVHLRMTGRLLWRAKSELSALSSPSFAQNEARKHLRLSFFMDRGQLDFLDVRRFGTVSLYGSEKEVRVGLGMEPLGKSFNSKNFRKTIEGCRQNIKSFLLRQDKIVGLGNIYVCEILYRSKISPERLVSTLSDTESNEIVTNTKYVLRKAIKNCGTTFSDFQQTTGETGSYQRFLKVYGQEGVSCGICQEEIIRKVHAGRSTFYCPSCQI